MSDITKYKIEPNPGGVAQAGHTEDRNFCVFNWKTSILKPFFESEARWPKTNVKKNRVQCRALKKNHLSVLFCRPLIIHHDWQLPQTASGHLHGGGSTTHPRIVHSSRAWCHPVLGHCHLLDIVGLQPVTFLLSAHEKQVYKKSSIPNNSLQITHWPGRVLPRNGV